MLRNRLQIHVGYIRVYAILLFEPSLNSVLHNCNRLMHPYQFAPTNAPQISVLKAAPVSETVFKNSKYFNLFTKMYNIQILN